MKKSLLIFLFLLSLFLCSCNINEYNNEYKSENNLIKKEIKKQKLPYNGIKDMTIDRTIDLRKDPTYP